MPRSFVLLKCLGVILSTLYSETAAAKPLPQSRAGDANFNLSCLLFGDTGCNIECSITSRLYDYGSNGACIEHNKLICYCDNHNAYSYFDPHKKWKKKFDDDYVFERIMKNKTTAKEAIEILDDPRVTGEELKELLKPILSPYQYSKLKLNDRSPAAEYIKKGKVDQQSVQKFISDQLDKFSQSLLTKDYRKRFRNALRNVRDKGTIYNFAYKVARMGNKALEEVFDEYLKNSKMKKPVVKLDEEPLINEILHYLIVNEFIKRKDARKRN